MNANIMKTQIFHRMKYDFKEFIVIERYCDFFTLRPDLLTTFT